MPKDNLPEHGAGAYNPGDPAEAEFWTGTVTVSHERRITKEDGCYTVDAAKAVLLDEVCNKHCEAMQDA